jgi:DNA-binding Lrp family transcriptional regulator
MWRYYQRGYSVQASYQLLNQREQLATYVTFPVGKDSWQEAFDITISQQSVVEASCVYGSTFNFVARTDTPDEAEIYYGLLPALAGSGLAGPATVLRATNSFHRPPANEMAGRGMIAYVFMKVPSKDIEEVMQTLHDFEEVVEAATVYGETDIVAKVVTADQAALDSLVLERFHRLEKVESTRTFIVIGGLHWERPSAILDSAEPATVSAIGLGDD